MALLAAPLTAQTGLLSPRESYDHALTLFGQGHVFTADELQSLETLKGKLVDSGDADLAADLAVLRLAAVTQADRAQASVDNVSSLLADTNTLQENVARVRDADAWKITRDIGLVTFSVSTVATLLLAVTTSQEDALLHSNLNNGAAKTTFSHQLELSMAVSAGVMLVSLFPLLWGEGNLP